MNSKFIFNGKNKKGLIVADFSIPPVFDQEIITKFDINGPRYTSYPTADRFHAAFTDKDAEIHIKGRSKDLEPAPLSLYVHIPFCSSICYYCACNKIITKDHAQSKQYLEYVAKEIALYKTLLNKKDQVVSQLHWGGGSPSFLSPDEMTTLMEHIKNNFSLTKNGEFSIEIDPRGLTESTITHLKKIGFNRLSMGIQDFDPDVQKAVNRIQSKEESSKIIRTARDSGFNSVSVDLMYGLPNQTLSKFERTLDSIIELSPDRLSIYNYAHLPNIFQPQRRISIASLPTPESRLNILSLAVKKLTGAGYVYIGMDHFAKPTDELAIAQLKKKLHRNFQGYSTFPDCDMLSLGVSSISKIGASYYQNHKTLEEYYQSIDQNKLPVLRGIALSQDDFLRRNIIQSLMCHFELDMEEFEKSNAIDFKEYFQPELERLGEYQKAGLITIKHKKIAIQPIGRFLVRAISMAFDRYLTRKAGSYSKVI